MTERPAKIRLHVDADLHEGQALVLRDQAHYLVGVMRQGAGDAITVFNGRDGAWRAEIAEAGKRQVIAVVQRQTAPQQDPPDLWLLFAPIKKARTDFIVEKAAELGAARILPVQTAHTNSERIRADRLQAHAVEAAEQCGGTFVPEVAPLQKLDALLADWPTDRRLMFCDESRVGRATPIEDLRAAASKNAASKNGASQNAAPKNGDPGPWAILIGPEGGFSEAERDRLAALPFAVPVSLGPRILRADTAAAAALTAWQLALGDWG